MSTYAAYYNLTQADKAEKMRRASQQSASSTTSQPERRRSSVQKILDALRPTEEVITPAGIYSPVIKRGSLFSRKQHSAESSRRSSEDQKAKRPSKDINMSREMRDMMHAAA